MILEMTNCTNCAKYKLLLTWSTFHFRGSKRPSIFICVKTKTWLKIWLLTWIPQIKTLRSLCLIKEGQTPSVVRNMSKSSYRTVTFMRAREKFTPTKPPTWSLHIYPNSKLSSYSVSPTVLRSVSPRPLNCIFLFKETYCFHLLPLYSLGGWAEYKKLDFK